MRLLVAAIVALLTLSATARAATVRTTFVAEDDVRGDLYVASLEFKGTGHERNDVQIDDRGANRYRVTDAAATLKPGRGCRRASRHVAICTLTNYDIAAVDVRLGAGDDRFRSHGLGDAILTVDGGAGADHLTGTDNDDRLPGGPGNDTLYGSFADDQLFGGPGDDRLAGGDDNDKLSGDGGRDIEHGGRGEDVLNGTDGSATAVASDVLDGGPGGDTVSYAGRRRAITASLETDRAGSGHESDRLTSIESVVGTRLADRLIGDAGDNLIDGGNGGYDRIDARGGDDDIELARKGQHADVHCGPGEDDVNSPTTAALLHADCEHVAYDGRIAVPAQPTAVTERLIVFTLPCPQKATPATLRVAPGTRSPLLARGTLAAGNPLKPCRATLRRAGRPLPHTFTLDAGDAGAWSLELNR